LEQVKQKSHKTGLCAQSVTSKTEEAAKSEGEPIKQEGHNPSRYGKFDSAESLYKAYQALEKEFTKRCQALKRLETDKQEQVTKHTPCTDDPSTNGAISNAVSTETTRLSPRQEQAQMQTEQPACAPLLIAGRGFFVPTPFAPPKTLVECKKFADKILYKG